MKKYKCYFNQEFYTISDYKNLMNHLKKDKKRDVFLTEIARNYNIFKSLLKLKELKLIEFSYEDSTEEEHIRFVDRLRKDIPIMERYIKKTELK